MRNIVILAFVFILSIDSISSQDWETIPGTASQIILRANNKTTRHYIGYIYGSQGNAPRRIEIKTRRGIFAGFPQIDIYEDIESPSGGGFLNTDFTMQVDGSGNLYVYVGGGAESRTNGTVSKYNGNNWENLGSFTNNTSGLLFNNTLAVTDSGTPYLGLPLIFDQSGTPSGDGIFRYDGTSWEEVGNENFPSGVARNSTIFFDSQEIPHVFYRDNEQLVVLKLNGGLWEPYENLSFGEEFNGISELAFGALNHLFVMGTDVNDNRNVVKFYNGTDWIDTNFLGSPSEMRIDGLGKPIVSGELNGRFAIQRYNTNEWVELGSPEWVDNLAVDGDGNVIIMQGSGTSYPGFTTQFYDGNFTDNESPLINCPLDIVASNDTGKCFSNIVVENPTAEDDITEPANITFEAIRSDGLELSDSFPIGETTITWVAIDEADNRSLPCEQIVTVNDVEDPLVICVDVTVELNVEGSVNISPDLVDGGSTDNCGIASLEVSPSTFLAEDLGENIVTLTITDESGNTSSCDAIVTVIEPSVIECTDNLPNEEVAIRLPDGQSFLGIDEIFGTDEITNGSPCALGLRNNDSGQPFANYRIPIDLSSNGIAPGDELFVSLDGYSLEGTARVELLQNNTPNQAIFSNTYVGGWTTASTTITVPDGLNSLDIWIYSNYLSSSPGTAYYDNLIVRKVDDDTERPFVTTWKTDNSGISGDNQITIPTVPGEIYNYKVDWGDGSSSDAVSGDVTHTYNSPGTYTVSITGDFPGIQFNNQGDKEKILFINQWGDILWTNMESSFYGCSNLDMIATDIPITGAVLNFFQMFRDCTSLVANSTIANWDVGNALGVGYMFAGAVLFNQDISDWEFGRIASMIGMFQNASSYNQPVDWPIFDFTPSMVDMFRGASSFDQDLSLMPRSGIDMTGILVDSGMSNENYERTLIGWANQPHFNGVTFDAPQNQYCDAREARQLLIDTFGWIINDAGETEECEGIVQCPNSLPNENSGIVLPMGNGFLGIDELVGTSENTNNSSCALILSNNDGGEPFANYRIPINLANYGINSGDRLFISLDGNSLEGVARVEINQDNRPNSALAFNTYSGGWSTFSTTITVPSGISSLDLWLYSNYLSSSPGSAIFDNLIIENLDAGTSSARELEREPVIFPNAANQTINFQFQQPMSLTEFQIFDLSGRLIKTLNVSGSSQNFELPVYDIPNGTYIITTLDGNGNLYQEQLAIKH